MIIDLLEAIFGDVKNVSPDMLEKVAKQYVEKRANEIIIGDRYIRNMHEYNDNLYKLVWSNVARNF